MEGKENPETTSYTILIPNNLEEQKRCFNEIKKILGRNAIFSDQDILAFKHNIKEYMHAYGISIRKNEKLNHFYNAEVDNPKLYLESIIQILNEIGGHYYLSQVENLNKNNKNTQENRDTINQDPEYSKYKGAAAGLQDALPGAIISHAQALPPVNHSKQEQPNFIPVEKSEEKNVNIVKIKEFLRIKAKINNSNYHKIEQFIGAINGLFADSQIMIAKDSDLEQTLKTKIKLTKDTIEGYESNPGINFLQDVLLPKVKILQTNLENMENAKEHIHTINALQGICNDLQIIIVQVQTPPSAQQTSSKQSIDNNNNNAPAKAQESKQEEVVDLQKIKADLVEYLNIPRSYLFQPTKESEEQYKKYGPEFVGDLGEHLASFESAIKQISKFTQNKSVGKKIKVLANISNPSSLLNELNPSASKPNPIINVNDFQRQEEFKDGLNKLSTEELQYKAEQFINYYLSDPRAVFLTPEQKNIFLNLSHILLDVYNEKSNKELSFMVIPENKWIANNFREKIQAHYTEQSKQEISSNWGYLGKEPEPSIDYSSGFNNNNNSSDGGKVTFTPSKPLSFANQITYDDAYDVRTLHNKIKSLIPENFSTKGTDGAKTKLIQTFKDKFYIGNKEKLERCAEILGEFKNEVENDKTLDEPIKKNLTKNIKELTEKYEENAKEFSASNKNSFDIKAGFKNLIGLGKQEKSESKRNSGVESPTAIQPDKEKQK